MVERDRVYREIYEYAQRVGGTGEDLDPDLEEAGLEHLWTVIGADEWSLPRL